MNEDGDETYNDLMLDKEDWDASVWRMSSSQYQKHTAKRYIDMRDQGTKKSVVDRILGQDWRAGLNSTQVADLDLAYYSQHANLKNWRAFKLEYNDNEGATNKARIEMLKVKRALSYHLVPYFKHHIQTLQDKDMLWIRISIHDGLAPNMLPAPASIVYFVWFINSEYLLGVTIKAEWRDFIMEALLRTFKGNEIEDWPLTGKSPKSLADLLLHKDSQGSHSRYRLNHLDDNPLSTVLKKRKPEDPLEKYTHGMQDIRAEDMNKIATRDRFVATEFGPNEQPSLHKVDLQLNLPFTTESVDFSLGRLTRQPFPIKVVLEGSNVIEGIKQLIPLGVAQNPMPKFLTELHSIASNNLTVDMDVEDGTTQRISTG
ncbi:hypothetical protein EDD11_007829 [Mortierella claussenii]|nr:hypothetical protein EDD11_007829 [Mortierella claussenii]